MLVKLVQRSLAIQRQPFFCFTPIWTKVTIYQEDRFNLTSHTNIQATILLLIEKNRMTSSNFEHPRLSRLSNVSETTWKDDVEQKHRRTTQYRIMAIHFFYWVIFLSCFHFSSRRLLEGIIFFFFNCGFVHFLLLQKNDHKRRTLKTRKTQSQILF